MYRARRLVFPALILGLVALAAFGMRQVVVSQDDPASPILPDEARAIADAAHLRSAEAVQEFVDSGGDPCSLPLHELLASIINPYLDLPALINDVDLIVTGTATANVVEAGGSRMLTTIQANEALMGTTPDEVLTIDSGQRVSLEGSELARSSIADPDLCNPGQVLLFLKRTALPGIYTYAPQGWVRIEGDLIEPAPFSKVFQDYAGAQALLADIRRIAEEQQAQGLPKGLLVCQSKHTSDTYRDPIVCPGDSFNPYQAFRLGTVSAAFVITTDPGPSDLALSRTDLKYDSPQLTAIMAALDVEVTLDPGGFRPDDLISLQVFTTEPVNERASYLFWYSPSSAMMQMVGSGGQFPAPPVFQLAMEPFLTVP